MVAPTEEITNIDRIEPYFIKPGDMFALSFPGNNWIVGQNVSSAKPQWYEYDPIAEGMLSGPIAPSTTINGITNHTFIKPSRPSSNYANGKPQFVFQSQPLDQHIYQLFWGISPSTLRVLFYSPSNTDQLGLPLQSANPTYNQFGAINGQESPINSIGPDTEIVLTSSLDFALGFVNDLPISVSPILKFRVNYFTWKPILDSKAVYQFLNYGPKNMKKIVGGDTGFNYGFETNLGVSPVHLGMSQSEIAGVLGK